MSDVLVYFLFVGSLIISGGFVVWAFTAEDRAALPHQRAEQVRLEIQLREMQAARAVRNSAG